MPRISATTPANSAPQPGVQAARHRERAVRCRGLAARDSHARHAAADRRTVHRHEDARATAAVGGPLADVDSGPAHGAMRPWMVLRPAGRATPRVPAVRAGPGVSYRMISAVVALDTALPSVRGTPSPPRGTAPVPAGRRDRHGSAPDCGGLGWTLGPPDALAPPRFRGGVRQHR